MMISRSTSSPESVGVIGCGWLGKALALTLLEQQCDVIATVQSSEKVDEVAKEGVKAEILLLPTVDVHKVEHRVFQQQQLVICIPPQLKQGKSDYPEKLNQIVKYAEQGGVQQLILVSTSSIYNGLLGDVNEDSPLNFSAEKVAILHQSEQVIEAFKGQVSILRLTGLIGPQRHPGRFFRGERVFTNPDGVVNLIHQEDAVGLLLCLLKKPQLQGIFNGVSNTHITRKSFYQLAAQSLHLPQPVFSETGLNDQSKLVTDEKSRHILAYKYIFDDLSEWLKRG